MESAVKRAEEENVFLECEKPWVYWLLIFTAGWFGAYTFLVRGGVFCNAQTANVVLLAMALGGREWARAAYLLLPISAYFAGAFFSEYLGKSVKRFHFLRWDTILIGIEILVVIVLGLLPAGVPDQICQISLNFICSMQFNTFRQVEGIPAATTFVTNHIRQVGSNFAKFLRHRDSASKEKVLTHGSLILFFALGAVVGAVCARFLGYYSIWGSGIIGDPDMLVYSAPYDPFDWKARSLNPDQEDPWQAEGQPEDGAGDILQPTWDGDSFQSLRQYGSNLLAVKRNSVWRIYGTDPGEFVMQQQYGGGTIQENTVVVYNNLAYMLGEHGIMRYDGTGVYPYIQENIHNLMQEMVNHGELGRACAGLRNGIYCLAIPINGSEFCNAILEYNTREQSLALRTGISVDSFMQLDERLFYTSASYPGRVFELRDDIGGTLPCVWVSGYQDLGMKNSIKSAFVLYAMVESEAPTELRIGIRTEKKLKQKIVNTKPGKMVRLHLNLQGRIFRLEVRSYSAVPFTIAGGIRIDLELDPD